jgi:hypothetical protein
LAAAGFAVLLLNIALMVQRVREQSKSWPAQFLRDLRHWDGRLPDDHDKHVHTQRSMCIREGLRLPRRLVRIQAHL